MSQRVCGSTVVLVDSRRSGEKSAQPRQGVCSAPALVAAVIGAVFLLVLAQTAVAQSGGLDTTFAPIGGPNGQIRALAIDADGKYLIGGLFSAYDGTPRSRIARVNADSSHDTTFDPGAGANDTVRGIAVDSLGRIYVCGFFTQFDNTPRNRIARLNPNGSLDITFDPGDGANDQVLGVAVDADDKPIIVGMFMQYDGTTRIRVARLNIDGSLDATFDPGDGATATNVECVAIDGNGQILIGGGFFQYDGVNSPGIARINPDGSRDISFTPGTGADFPVYVITFDADGKILIGGNFTQYNGTNRKCIARLNTDGTLDTSFDPGTGPFGDEVRAVAVFPDGKIVIGGDFTQYDGDPINRLARLNPDGTLDSTFIVGTGANATVFQAALTSEKRIVIGGSFTQYNGVFRFFMARVNAGVGSAGFASASSSVAENAGTATITLRRSGGSDGALSAILAITGGTAVAGTDYEGFSTPGTLDMDFDPGTGANEIVRTMAIDDDGKILIGGDFTQIGGTSRNRIARLHPDGTLDTTFDPGSGPNSSVLSLAIDDDGKILISGFFSQVAGTPRSRIARLDPDGTLDTSFNPGSGANGTVFSITIDDAGKILIGGNFTQYDGISRSCIARLDPDGTLDTSFNPGSGANGPASSVVIDDDGKILIGGSFTEYDGTPRNRIARLDPNGTLDTSFDPDSGANSTVFSIGVDADGKILIGGFFTEYNGTPRGRIARLNADGSLDTSFDPGSGANASVYAVAINDDGKIVIGGGFTQVADTSRNSIARLNADGSLDTSFDPGTGANEPVETIVMDGAGKILIGGDFTEYDGTPRSRIAHIHNDTRVTWGDGDMADKTVDLTIFDNAINHPNRSIVFSVESVFPGTVGAFATHTLIILDDDPPGFVTDVTSTTADGTYAIGAVIDLSVKFSQPIFVNTVGGTPSIALNSGGTAVYTAGHATDTLTFTYTVGAGHSSADLDYTATTALTLNGGTLTDGFQNATLTLPAPGGAGSLGANADIVIDGVRPTIASITSTTPDDIYIATSVISITVNFSEAVTLSGGNLEITLDTGAVVVIAPFGPATSASGTYTVVAGDNSAALDSVSPVVLTAGTILDAAGNAMTNFAIPNGQSLADAHAIVIDTQNPTITSITSTTADGTYNPDDTVNITVNFSEAVTLSGGNLEITLDTGAVVVIAPFGPATSASGTYTVAAGDNSAALDSVSVVLEAGATIEDAAENAMTDFAIPAGQSLADAHAIVIESLPELLLKRGDTVITLDGSDVIGNISADGGVFSVTYTAENIGSGALIITAIEIDGLSNADSTLNLPSMPITIAPGNSETFTVRISPSKKGEFNATIRIDSNLPGQSSVTITVSGTGTVSAGCGIIPFGATATGFGSAGRGGSVGAVWPLLLAFVALLIVASLRRRWAPLGAVTA